MRSALLVRNWIDCRNDDGPKDLRLNHNSTDWLIFKQQQAIDAFWISVSLAAYYLVEHAHQLFT